MADSTLSPEKQQRISDLLDAAAKLIDGLSNEQQLKTLRLLRTGDTVTVHWLNYSPEFAAAILTACGLVSKSGIRVDYRGGTMHIHLNQKPGQWDSVDAREMGREGSALQEVRRLERQEYWL